MFSAAGALAPPRPVRRDRPGWVGVRRGRTRAFSWSRPYARHVRARRITSALVRISSRWLAGYSYPVGVVRVVLAAPAEIY